LYILAFLLFFAAAIPIASGYFQTVTITEAPSVTKRAGVTENFGIYRYAVLNYMENNTTFTGTVPDSALHLPPNFVKLGDWTNLVQGGFIVIYSASPSGLLSSAILIKSNTTDKAISYTANGRVISPIIGDSGPSFAFVPDGALISVIQQY